MASNSEQITPAILESSTTDDSEVEKKNVKTCLTCIWPVGLTYLAVIPNHSSCEHKRRMISEHDICVTKHTQMSSKAHIYVGVESVPAMQYYLYF